MVQQKNNTGKGTEHTALAKSLNIPVSTKHCIEIAKALRYKSTEYAKRYLEDVVALRRAVPFKTFNGNVGHKAGMASGRFPEKAARQFIKLVNSVEANAQFKGLNTADLKIVKMTANLASIPSGGGRQRHKTKRTHLEIVVRERTKSAKKKETKQKVGSVSTEPRVGESKVSEAKLSESKVTETKVKATESPATQSAHSPSTHSSAHPAPKSELSSEDLLKKAQARAAALNKAETDKKSVEKVSKLYDELTSKGTLRDEKTTSVKK